MQKIDQKQRKKVENLVNAGLKYGKNCDKLLQMGQKLDKIWVQNAENWPKI